MGHQDRFSGQADLDDEGDPCKSGRKRGYHSPARNLHCCQVHHRKPPLNGQRGHGYGGPWLHHGRPWRWGAPRRKEDLGHGPRGHTRASVSHPVSMSEALYIQTHAQVQCTVPRKLSLIWNCLRGWEGCTRWHMDTHTHTNAHTHTHTHIHTHTHWAESRFLCVLCPLPSSGSRKKPLSRKLFFFLSATSSERSCYKTPVIVLAWQAWAVCVRVSSTVFPPSPLTRPK